MITETPLADDYFEDAVLAKLLLWPGAQVQHFWIPGQPMPNERPRVIRAGDKAWAYTPKTTLLARQNIFNSVYKQNPRRFAPPFTVALKFIFSPDSRESDVDNLAKLFFDAVFSDKKAMPPFPFRDDKFINNFLCFKRKAITEESIGTHFWMVKCP